MGKRKKSTTVSDIHDDCLLLIFNHLNVTDKACARLVCKRWFSVVEKTLRKQAVLSTQAQDTPRWTKCSKHSASVSNTLTGFGRSSLIPFVDKCINVIAINLHSIRITPLMMKKLRTSKCWSKLVHLEIAYCKIDQLDKLSFYESIRKCSQLRHFTFYKTSDVQSNDIVCHVGSMQSLTSFTLGFHTYSARLQLDTLGPNISRLELHGLGLSFNDMERLGSRPTTANHKLKQLKIKNSYMSETTLELIAAKFPNLTTLDIPLPTVHGALAPVLAQSISNLSKLERVSLTHRHLYEDLNVDDAVTEIA